MGFFNKDKHKFTKDCIYDPYADHESEIVGEVQRIIKNDEIDELEDYENFLRTHEEERKHLETLYEIAQGCDRHEIICFLLSARRTYPDVWHKVNKRIDDEQRYKLEQYERIYKGEIVYDKIRKRTD